METFRAKFKLPVKLEQELTTLQCILEPREFSIADVKSALSAASNGDGIINKSLRFLRSQYSVKRTTAEYVQTSEAAASMNERIVSLKARLDEMEGAGVPTWDDLQALCNLRLDVGNLLGSVPNDSTHQSVDTEAAIGRADAMLHQAALRHAANMGEAASAILNNELGDADPDVLAKESVLQMAERFKRFVENQFAEVRCIMPIAEEAEQMRVYMLQGVELMEAISNLLVCPLPYDDPSPDGQPYDPSKDDPVRILPIANWISLGLERLNPDVFGQVAPFGLPRCFLDENCKIFQLATKVRQHLVDRKDTYQRVAFETIMQIMDQLGMSSSQTGDTRMEKLLSTKPDATTTFEGFDELVKNFNGVNMKNLDLVRATEPLLMIDTGAKGYGELLGFRAILVVAHAFCKIIQLKPWTCKDEWHGVHAAAKVKEAGKDVVETLRIIKGNINKFQRYFDNSSIVTEHGVHLPHDVPRWWAIVCDSMKVWEGAFFEAVEGALQVTMNILRDVNARIGDVYANVEVIDKEPFKGSGDMLRLFGNQLSIVVSMKEFCPGGWTTDKHAEATAVKMAARESVCTVALARCVGKKEVVQVQEAIQMAIRCKACHCLYACIWPSINITPLYSI